MGSINFNIEKVFEKAPEAKEFNEIIKSINDREDQSMIDEDLLKRNQDWSVLANQVVGGENE